MKNLVNMPSNSDQVQVVKVVNSVLSSNGDTGISVSDTLLRSCSSSVSLERYHV